MSNNYNGVPRSGPRSSFSASRPVSGSSTASATPKRSNANVNGGIVSSAGLVSGNATPQITFNQPVVARGENKRLLELSVAEAGPAFIAAGLITEEALESALAEMRRMNADDTVLAVMPRMSQVWATKPAR